LPECSLAVSESAARATKLEVDGGSVAEERRAEGRGGVGGGVEGVEGKGVVLERVERA